MEEGLKESYIWKEMIFRVFGGFWFDDICGLLVGGETAR